MAEKKRGHAGGSPPALSATQPQAEPAAENEWRDSQSEDTSGKDTKDMPSHGFKTETPIEGVTVIGEAVRRVLPERAEFLIEVTATAPTAAQALRDNYVKATQVTQAAGTLGVQPVDVQTISVRVRNLYAPAMQSLPSYVGMPQIGQGGFPPFPAAGNIPPEVQFGSYQASNTLRINVRETTRVGDVADAVTRAGATILGPFSFLPADEAAARRSAVEAAGKDARMKAEALAMAAGKQVGDPIAISEDIVATNGTYTAFRAALPLAFGAGAPEVAGDLEYYARVSAAFRFQ
ncbi:MAG TPA: SIMPL domain-containing protein [Bryobacteraceae bacterium]|nr:SIMPL domain-containing protein [Bryobacteraceae bacterium]